jgi:hypothetical protein
MKYEIELCKNEHKTVEVFAESPAAALKLAKESNPGFKAECATELLGEDETGKCFEVVAHCEGCERPIFDGEKYGSDEEGVSICADCLPLENDKDQATRGA